VEAVFADDKAGLSGLALSRVAGPIPALRCGDLLGIFSFTAAALDKGVQQDAVGERHRRAEC
jgi:hypothetical protein